jgi:hypothetical protein
VSELADAAQQRTTEAAACRAAAAAESSSQALLAALVSAEAAAQEKLGDLLRCIEDLAGQVRAEQRCGAAVFYLGCCRLG